MYSYSKDRQKNSALEVIGKWTVELYDVHSDMCIHLFCPQSSVQNELVLIQPEFKSQLLIAVEQYGMDVDDFERNYLTVSVMHALFLATQKY